MFITRAAADEIQGALPPAFYHNAGYEPAGAAGEVPQRLSLYNRKGICVAVGAFHNERDALTWLDELDAKILDVGGRQRIIIGACIWDGNGGSANYDPDLPVIAALLTEDMMTMDEVRAEGDAELTAMYAAEVAKRVAANQERAAGGR